MVDATLKFSNSALEGLNTLQNIAYANDAAFRQIPSVVVVNKIDLGDDLGKLEKELKRAGQIYFLISVKTGEGVESLMKFIHERIENEGHV